MHFKAALEVHFSFDSIAFMDITDQQLLKRDLIRDIKIRSGRKLLR